MTHEIKVLDHGFVRLRNLAGPTNRMSGDADRAFCADDTDVANAARMSFNQTDSNRSYEMEMKLNKYLLENRHMTPFESIEVWLEMKLPIFVARQFVRHRTAALNEVSGRYVTLPEEWYIPEVVGGKAANKKQGQDDNLDFETQFLFKTELQFQCEESYKKYLKFIKMGVAPEHARMFLHVNHYTHWLWKQDLRNLFGFLCLRQHSHAQIEARQYADAIVALLEPHIPGLMALYNDIMRVPE
jgi:thymidylate synthase (FAD)